MQRINASRLVVGTVVALLVVLSCCVVPANATSTGGVTITPAALKLDLPKDDIKTIATFTVTNTYSTSVVLDFAFEADSQTLGQQTATRNLSLSSPEITLESGASAEQTITLQDSEQLAPGSQQLHLIVKQQASGMGSVGVVPTIRLPLTVIKESGAITQISFGALSSPSLAFNLPDSSNVTLHNSGNMIAIPHGVITITGPSGDVLRQGTVNVAAMAVTPGNDITFATQLTQLDRGILPGVYHIQLTYGLGGDNPTKTVSTSFFYLAWWHIIALALLFIAGYYAIKQAIYMRAVLHARKKQGNRRPALAGRHAP